MTSWRSRDTCRGAWALVQAIRTDVLIKYELLDTAMKTRDSEGGYNVVAILYNVKLRFVVQYDHQYKITGFLRGKKGEIETLMSLRRVGTEYCKATWVA